MQIFRLQKRQTHVSIAAYLKVLETTISKTRTLKVVETTASNVRILEAAASNIRTKNNDFKRSLLMFTLEVDVTKSCF